MLRESFSKTGSCCCGPGETCGPSDESAKEKREKTKAAKPAQTTLK